MNDEEKKQLAIEHDKEIVFAERGLEIRNLHDLHRVSTYLVASQFVPNGDTVADCMVKIQMGRELGLPLMTSLNKICVINGRPSVWGNAVPGLLFSTGELEVFQEWFEGTPYEEDYTAICLMKRKGFTEVRREFSVKQAKLANLWNKRGHNNQPTPWVYYPDRMLQMRARKFCADDCMPDALNGLYMVEEAMDLPPMPAQDVEVSDASPEEHTVPTDFEAAAEKLKRTSPKNRSNGNGKKAKPAPSSEPEEERDPGLAIDEPDEPTPDPKEALYARIEALTKGMDAETFDAKCAEVAAGKTPDKMTVEELDALAKALEKKNAPEPVATVAVPAELF